MLETLVSSKTRRTLFEYLLTHPNDRFYLRGLAKQLELSVSPLRRELKRLEQSGVLRPFEEANALFYAVNTDAPAFRQLQQAVQPLTPPNNAAAEQAAVPAAAEPAVVVEARPVPITSPQHPAMPALLAAAGVGITLLLVIAGLFYLTMTNQHLLSLAQRGAPADKPGITVVAPVTPPPSSSGTMSGARWRLIPGAIGGSFGTSPPSTQESY